jgi:hypothetical protein
VISCPHCAGVKGTTFCCLCDGTRLVPDDPNAIAWIWAYADCACETCLAITNRFGKPRTLQPRPILTSVTGTPATERTCACGAEYVVWANSKVGSETCPACVTAHLRTAARDYQRRSRETRCSLH